MNAKIDEYTVHTQTLRFLAKGGKIQHQHTEVARDQITARRHVDPKGNTISEVMGTAMQIEGAYQG